MIKHASRAAALSLTLTLCIPAALAQDASPSATKAPALAPLVVYFDSGSSAVRGADLAVLDQASRLYRDGKPIVMVVSGSTDATGSPELNLRLSEQRASTVLQGLIARGIPAERFQVLAKGGTDPAVPGSGAEARNRRVEISWR